MPTRNVLFLCTHNSARSILAETILATKGGDRFRAFSAGSSPNAAPNPLALKLLAAKGHPIEHLRSKSWNVFAGPSAPQLDVVITVCDDAASESCPVWPGRPATAHWGIADPSTAEGDESARTMAFERTYAQLEERIDQLLALPPDLQDVSFSEALERIGPVSEGSFRRKILCLTESCRPPVGEHHEQEVERATSRVSAMSATTSAARLTLLRPIVSVASIAFTPGVTLLMGPFWAPFWRGSPCHELSQSRLKAPAS